MTVDAEGKETVTATELSWKFNTLTAVQFPNKVVFSGIPGMEGDVVISTVIELKSLVLKPTLYYHGIQAIEIAAFNYQSLIKNAVDANGNYSKDAPYNNQVVGEVNMVPDMSATYHLNPSNAMVKNNVSNYKFAVLNKEYTRAINPKTVVPSIYKVDLSTKGLVTLTSHLANADLIQDIQRDEAVTVLALQYTEGDTTITSDYAAIRASEYKNLVLNNAYWSTDQNQHNHLFTTAAAAIADDDMAVPVKWNESIDLDKVVNTHRDVVKTKNTDVVWDKNAEEGLVEKFGFKYSYELVGWWAGDDASANTSQSAHAAIGEGNILRPQMVKDGKQQAYGAEQNKATIGRQPLVRVTLTDTITNNIAAVGYVKFEITEEEPTKPSESLTTVDFPAFTKDYTVLCDNGEVFTEKLVWHQVEEKILAKVNLSKEVFEANYTLEEGTSTIGATQYEANTADAKVLDPYFGKVELASEEIGGTTTEVLKWTINNVEAYNVFKANASKTIYVRYKKTGSVGPVNYVCVALTWSPKTRNVAPAASIEDGDKIKQYWYAKNNSTAGTGYADIHGNVEVVGQENAEDRFIFDVNNTFVGNTVQLKGLPAAYKAINDAKTIKFSFVKPEVNTDIPTASGAKYNVGVNADGTIFGTINTNNEITNTIATIDPTTGIITYADNNVAKDILNAADHSELGDRQTLTGRVAITATTCDPAKAIELTNNAFNVKFLRPVTVKDGKAAFIDAETNGSVAPVELTFVDWRDHNFTDDKATKGENYFEYYGVASIEADIDNITTTLNGDPIEKGVKLSDITNNIKFEYTAPATISANNYGELKYENNGTTVGDFMIRVPIKVTYDWGTIYTYVDATVGKTEANANRR